MARAIGRGHQVIGLIDCLACGKEMPAKETAGGKLSLCCTWCDMPLYLNPGTKAYDLVRARVRPIAASPAPADPAKPADPAPPPAPEKKEDPPPAPPRRSFAGPLFGGS